MDEIKPAPGFGGWFRQIDLLWKFKTVGVIVNPKLQSLRATNHLDVDRFLFVFAAHMADRIVARLRYRQLAGLQLFPSSALFAEKIANNRRHRAHRSQIA